MIRSAAILLFLSFSYFLSSVENADPFPGTDVLSNALPADAIAYNSNSYSKKYTSPGNGHNNQTAIYSSDIPTGLIGTTINDPVDNPYDNIFHVKIPSLPADGVAYLKFDLFGVENHVGVARSINDQQAIGGKFVSLNNAWSSQVEAIPLSTLRAGDNTIRFGLSSEANYYYRVKDVSIMVEKKTQLKGDIIVTSTNLYAHDSQAYIKGIIQVPKGKGLPHLTEFYCNGKREPVHNYEFEVIIPTVHTTSGAQINLSATVGAEKIEKTISFAKVEPVDSLYEGSISKGVNASRTYHPNHSLTLNLPLTYDASVLIPAFAMSGSCEISITALRDVDMPPLHVDMVNVTKGAAGYRFLPHDAQFTNPARITLPFDSAKIPDGYTPTDIRTYFFDAVGREWVPLDLDTLDFQNSAVVSSSSRFTDMINGIIKVPESPQTQSYTPTSIKDLKAAHPSAGIVSIDPPNANSAGSAMLRFDLKLPKGRQGLQPELRLQYNSDGGNGWIGLGWVLPIASIGIDTRWGVPRYDATSETETYTLGGEQLAPIADKVRFKPRAAEKRFYPRVEGQFNRIVRRGSHPKNYWWDVTDKTGTRMFYGGTPTAGQIETAVLKDDDGNIAQWALVETRDLHNNFIRYVYDTVHDAGVVSGSVPGKQLYLSKIVYTGHGTADGLYSVEFIRDRQLGEPKRKDVEINGRLGFKLVTADRLRRITIKFNGQVIRSYELKYKEGAFYKTLLNTVTEIDATGNSFYSHDFDYYDDVSSSTGYAPFASTNQNWSPDNDNITADILNSLPGFSGRASALNATKSKSSGKSIATTIGVWDFIYDKTNTVGGTRGSASSQSEGLVSLVDINGDGRPDKVFKKNGDLWYRPNLGNTSQPFGNARRILGISNFHTGNSTTNSKGSEINAIGGFYGYTKSNTINTTQDYFADFNGDGLIDVASNGKVYFNRVSASGDPIFLPTSDGTPSPIYTGSNVAAKFLAPDTALQRQQERDYPLQDIVRLWVAPHAGTVSVTAPVRLVPSLPNAKKDGVRVSIQLGDAVLWNAAISATDFSYKNPTGLSALTVAKGDRFFFRVQSVYNGEDDLVEWDPIIQYNTINAPAIDANGRSSNYYQASKDFILSNNSGTKFFKDGVIKIDGHFRKAVTSDTVRVIIAKEAGGISTVIYEQVFPCSTVINQPIIVDNIPVFANETLKFILSSDSYIDRAALEWTPHFQYIAFTDAMPVIGADGKPSIEEHVAPNNANYNDWLKAANSFSKSAIDTVAIKPYLVPPLTANGTVAFTIKRTTSIIAKRLLQIVNGVITTAIDSIPIDPRGNDTLYIDFHTADRNLALALLKTQFIAFKDSSYIDAFGNTIKVELTDTLEGNLYTEPSEMYLGSLFRGWGHFSFKGAGGNAPLDQMKLNTNGLAGYSIDPELYKDSLLFGNVVDVSGTDFIPLYTDVERMAWVGFDSSVYITGTHLSSARLWLHDVSVDSLMSGGDVMFVNKVTETKSFSQALGLSQILNGTSNVSRSTTTNRLEVLDMNGDGYPDVVSQDDIQYTLPGGGLESIHRTHGLQASIFEGSSKARSLGGGIPTAFAKNFLSITANHVGINVSTAIGLSKSASIGSNNDRVPSTWIDMNGDGLPDKVFSNGDVCINLGYRFSIPEKWGFDDELEKNATADTSAGANLGFSAGFGSKQFGFSLQRSDGKASSLFIDVNADGLPDQLTHSVPISVRLNNGSGFEVLPSWNGAEDIRTTASVGESYNKATTKVTLVPFFLSFLKFCNNPSSYNGIGISSENVQIVDVDGDRYPDIVQSNNDGHLVAKLSTISRTNMLRSVQRPMGSNFSIEYERIGNTVDLPQSKWVLKAFELRDAVPGDGVDTTRTQFNYSGGYYDRHEREFLGFSKVETHEVNTASGNTVYRSTIQEFDNTTFYTRGLLRSQWQQDGSARKFMQTKNTYDVRAVADSVKFPALVKSERFFYEGASSPGITTNTEFDYDDFGNIIEINDAGDGSMQDVLLTNIDYYHVEPLYIHAIPSRIIVRDISRVIVRWRETRINPTTADITQILQYLTNDSVATYDFSYNTFGNLTEVINPENYKAQRLRYTFEFDNQVNTYITKVSDSYGYSSASTYDYRFGEVIGTTSIQNQPMRYSLDNRGRVIRITGPYEIAANKPYTIAFEYNPDSLVPYAVTRHHDPEYNADIVTYTFSDGLGRPIQLKKQAALFKGKNVPDDIQLIVSGRNFYDAFGRIVESFNPTTEVIGPRSRELSSARGQSQATFAYDVLDRPLNSRLADGATTSFTYGISGGFLSVTQKDAYNNVKEILTDVKERTRVMNVHGPNGIITTKYHYNALSELLRVVDAGNNTIAYAYDRIGRQLSMNHPDAGLTTLKYDLAGNVLEKITPQIRHEIPNGGAIKYFYDQERVTDIDYPRQYQNRVKLTYGKPGMGNRTGRLILQQDASGGQEFYYGKLGEITKTIRTVVVSNVFYTTYVSEQEYDTWNRVKKMIYPDGEIVQYFYNRGGTLNRMAGSKAGNNYTYINQIGYDEFGQRVYLLYGNGTESRYTYDEQRRWLKNLTSLTAAGRVFMSNKYKFDLVNNIQEINNDIPLQPNFLGGKSTHTYEYDNLYRLAEAKGRYKSSTDTSYYNLSMTYDNLYNIVSKNMEMPQTRASYNDTFSYAGTGPHQPSRIGAVSYRYDLNGNLLFHGKRKYFWDEENRLMAAIDDGILSQYTYDANGERAVKSTGGLRGTWVNGAPAGIVNHDSSYTAYVSPYLVCRRTSFTKHYYIEGQRIASKIGIGRFKNISFPQPAITAGGIDYLSRIRQIQRDRYAYYNSLGVSPGPPTDKYFYAHPYNRGIASPVIVDSTGSSVPAGWPGNTTPPPMGPPIFVDPIPSNDSVKAGYGFIGTGFFYEQNQFFYHPDHLGSTSYVTNVFGEVSQHTEYAAYGETFVEEHTNSNITPYLFNAKERDAETGLYYYGARYYDPRISIWLSVDPLMDEPEQIEKSPYAYTWNNPIRYTDPDGKFIDIVADVGFILFDIGKLAYDQITTGTTKPEDWKALAADAAGAAIPGVTGLGLAVRASKAVNQTVKASKTAEKLGEASKLVDNASDLHKSDNLSQAGGVYQLKTSLGTYVGQAKDVMKRVTSHFAKGGKLSASELQNAIRHSMPGASKTQREAYEQYLVNKYGLGNLLNIRNPMGGRMDKYKKIIDDVINQFNLPR